MSNFIQIVLYNRNEYFLGSSKLTTVKINVQKTHTIILYFAFHWHIYLTNSNLESSCQVGFVKEMDCLEINSRNRCS